MLLFSSNCCQLTSIVTSNQLQMSQELKQRVNATSEKQLSSSKSEKTSKNSLLSDLPDYAIQVLYKYDEKTKRTDLESEANLKILTSILKLHGFIVEVRPDTNTNLLIVLVTLNEASFEKLVELSNEIDGLFNIKHNATSDEKISIAERLRLIYLKLTLPKSKGGCDISVGKNNVKNIVPVKHIMNLDKESKLNMKNIGKLFRKPIRDQNSLFLRQNFGSKYAIYYNFVQAYVSSIGCISVFGIISWYFLGNFSLIYAIINLFIGLTCYLCIYASEKKLKNDWNLNNISKTETIRLEEDDLIPKWKILLRQVCFIPITLSSATALFTTQFICFLIEIFLTEIYQGPFKSILALVPTILVIVLVPVVTIIYGVVAKKYLAFEKNPTQESENKSLIVKMFLFNCLAAYAPLLITSFIYLPIGYCLDPYLQTIKAILSKATSAYNYIPNIPTLESEYKVNSMRMSSQIFYFMVINQVVGTFVEFAVPIILSKVLSIGKIASILGTPASSKKLDFKKLDNEEEHEFLELVRLQFSKPEVNIDDDYRQNVLQYGFLMFFGPVWTLGALSCFIFGLIQQEGDYMKYIKLSKPVISARSESSQPWVSFMRYLLIIGSFISIAITLMYNNGINSKSDEIESYIGQTSVDNSWFVIISGSLISVISMQVIVYCFETIIDHVYDSNDSNDFSKEVEATNIMSKYSKREDESDINVENVLEAAIAIQSKF